MKSIVLSMAILAGLASAGPAAASSKMAKVDTRSTFVDAVSGRTLAISLYGIKLQVRPDGQITGKAVGRNVKGAWKWQDGFFCRSLAWGERDLPYNCQRVDTDGHKIRFTSDKGAGRSADFNLQ